MKKPLFLIYMNRFLMLLYWGLAVFYFLDFIQDRSWVNLAMVALESVLGFVFTYFVWRDRKTWALKAKKSRSLKSPPQHLSSFPNPAPSLNPNPLKHSLYQPGSLFRPELPKRKLDKPVVGFRCWVPIHYAPEQVRLSALNIPFGFWMPGVNQATCMSHINLVEPHPCPSPRCMCGFWIKDSFVGSKKHWSPTTAILGIAMGWGRVIHHEDGWRCQYGSVVALMLTDEQAGFSMLDALYGGSRLFEAATKVAVQYDVPLLRSEDALQTWYAENTEK